MTLKTQMAADGEDVFCNTGDFGEACTYVHISDSSSDSVSAVIRRMEIETDFEIEGEYVRKIGKAIIPVSQLSPTPARGDTLKDASGEMWIVTSIAAADDAVYVINLKKLSRASQGSLKGNE
jgi:hypothetical protein